MEPERGLEVSVSASVEREGLLAAREAVLLQVSRWSTLAADKMC